jgi:hypothetical protein
MQVEPHTLAHMAGELVLAVGGVTWRQRVHIHGGDGLGGSSDERRRHTQRNGRPRWRAGRRWHDDGTERRPPARALQQLRRREAAAPRLEPPPTTSRSGGGQRSSSRSGRRGRRGAQRPSPGSEQLRHAARTRWCSASATCSVSRRIAATSASWSHTDRGGHCSRPSLTPPPRVGWWVTTAAELLAAGAWTHCYLSSTKLLDTEPPPVLHRAAVVAAAAAAATPRHTPPHWPLCACGA